MVVRKHVVAIDGPAGVGKTSTSKLVAGRLGYVYVDTGALYRAVAWKFLQEGVKLSDKKRLRDALKGMSLQVKPERNRLRILIGGKDVTNRLRSRKITGLSSKVAAIAAVRKFLVEIQRKAGKKGGVVMEGRDIGTVIFPATPYKFFLTASIEMRAMRRYLELKGQGRDVVLSEIKRDIIARDRRDSGRKISPLRRAKDAVLVDSTNITMREVVNCIVSKIK